MTGLTHATTKDPRRDGVGLDDCLTGCPGCSLTGSDVQDGSLGRADVGESLIRLGTQQATTSGTFKEFTGIPSWARRVTLHLWYVSTNGAANMLVQLGTGGAPTASGYA